ncbi:MAG: hypothetical protein E7582_02005 [Ruminococcaceae bacterium]|nr:hypothetical protein [Oscillospiraceae bacterium]
MEANNSLSWSNYFLAEDGSIIARDSDSDRKEAGYTNGVNIDYIVTALDSNGVFHYANLINDRYSANVGSASLDSVNDDSTWHKYTPDGKEYYSDYNGTWVEDEY